MPISRMFKWTCTGCDKDQPCTMFGVAEPGCPYHTPENMELTKVLVAPPKSSKVAKISTSSNTSKATISRDPCIGCGNAANCKIYEKCTDKLEYEKQ